MQECLSRSDKGIRGSASEFCPGGALSVTRYSALSCGRLVVQKNKGGFLMAKIKQRFGRRSWSSGLLMFLTLLILCPPLPAQTTDEEPLLSERPELQGALLELQSELDALGATFEVGYNPAMEQSLSEITGLIVPPDWRETGEFVDVPPFLTTYHQPGFRLAGAAGWQYPGKRSGCMRLLLGLCNRHAPGDHRQQSLRKDGRPFGTAPHFVQQILLWLQRRMVSPCPSHKQV